MDDLHGSADDRYMPEKPYPSPSLRMPFEVVPLIDKLDLAMPFFKALALVDHPFEQIYRVSDVLVFKHCQLDKRRVGLENDLRIWEAVFYGEDDLFDIFLGEVKEQPLGDEQCFFVFGYLVHP